ncbi:MAG: carbohydrate ABC transporter permease [Clostridia bacterium]|nr:carbohydrate ABC transporter permease [Clostridia bacterium]
MRKKRLNNRNRSRGGNAVIFFMLGLVGLFMALPLVYAVVQSVKPIEELFIFPPRFYASNPTLDNFRDLLSVSSTLWVPFERYVLNSVFVSILSTGGHVIIASMAAYTLAKHPFPGNKMFFNIIVTALMFSAPVTAIPSYIVMARMGLINNYLALILPSFASPMGLYLMKQFMGQIPNVMLEAARIDGAREFRIFFRIVMPQVKPAWLTLVIFAFQAAWNQTGATFIYNEELKLLPTILGQISSGGIARAGISSAAAVLLMIPPIATFLVTQSNVIETMSHSGIKE